MNSGETLQSYSHQLVVTKSEKQMMQLDSDSDNIDVGNDNDKDLGNYFSLPLSKYISKNQNA